MNESWSTSDMRLLEYFDKRENKLPFSVVKLDKGYFQASGEWDGFIFNSKKVKKRVVKKALTQGK